MSQRYKKIATIKQNEAKIYADLLNKTKLKAVRKLPTLTC